jgi:hypothetical protein
MILWGFFSIRKILFFPQQSKACQEPKLKKQKIDHTSLLGKFRNVSRLPAEDNLSLEDFLEKFKKNGIPVVIRGALEDWPALEEGGENQWSVEYLKKVVLNSDCCFNFQRKY